MGRITLLFIIPPMTPNSKQKSLVAFAGTLVYNKYSKKTEHGGSL
jgi:hypothetical protein